MFCKGCLNRYFQNNVARKSCPQCKESGLSKQTMKVSQFVTRLINALEVKCELECGWNGTLGDLQGHTMNRCPFLQMKCEKCDKYMKRAQLNTHQCPKEKLECSKCEMEVMRENIDAHIIVCSQKWLQKKGNMTNSEHREIIAKALKYCHQQGKLNKHDIREKLDEQGMKAMVIVGFVSLSYNSGSDSITYSKWKVDEESLFTIMCIKYEASIDDISCVKDGSMNEQQRGFVLDALEHCSEKNEMKPINIRDRLYDLGMKTMVLRNMDGFAFESGLEKMKWSQWKSTKYGKYLIVMIQYRPKNSDEIKCINRGNMSNDDRNIVLQSLRHCLTMNKMKACHIAKRLRDEGINSLVMKDCMNGFSIKGSFTASWSKWEISAFGIYNVVMFANDDGSDDNVSDSD